VLCLGDFKQTNFPPLTIPDIPGLLRNFQTKNRKALPPPAKK